MIEPRHPSVPSTTPDLLGRLECGQHRCLRDVTGAHHGVANRSLLDMLAARHTRLRHVQATNHARRVHAPGETT
jgi:hypothetical protein